MQSIDRKPGFSLIEMLVAIAVLGIVLAVATPSLSDMLERRRVIAATGELVSLFNFSKSQAKVVDTAFILHLETPADDRISCARLSTLSNQDTCGCDYAEACKDGASALIRAFEPEKSTGVSFTAAADDWGFENKHELQFSHNTMSTEKNVRLTVTGSRTGAQLQVNYNNAGLTTVCSPSGTMRGYPRC